jgi:hypothetical protein
MREVFPRRGALRAHFQKKGLEIEGRGDKLMVPGKMRFRTGRKNAREGDATDES